MLVGLSVKHVVREPVSSRYMLILKADNNAGYYLKINIGEHEGEAVDHWLKSIEPPRPMTYDMISSILNLSENLKILKIIIDRCDEMGVFFAKLIVSIDGAEKVIDCRPSDAVAVGIRLDTPIFTDIKILDKYGICCPSDQG